MIATDAALTEQPSPAATDYYAGLEDQMTPAYDQGTLTGAATVLNPQVDPRDLVVSTGRWHAKLASPRHNLCCMHKMFLMLGMKR